MSTLEKESINYMHRRPLQKSKKLYKQKGKQPAMQPNMQKQNSTTGNDCHWCDAKLAHPRKTCPARNTKCKRCRKNRHYGHKCQSGKSKSNMAFLGKVQSSTNTFSLVNLHVNKHRYLTSFKLFQPVTVWYQLCTGNLSVDNDWYPTGP